MRHRGTRLGMPEITLGILPGAGGTQRLPRLVGIEGALDLLLSGAPIDATRARELGLIDEIVGDDALEGGIDYARRLLAQGAGPRPTRARPAPAPLSGAAIAGAWRVMRVASRAATRNTWYSNPFAPPANCPSMKD